MWILVDELICWLHDGTKPLTQPIIVYNIPRNVFCAYFLATYLCKVFAMSVLKMADPFPGNNAWTLRSPVTRGDVSYTSIYLDNGLSSVRLQAIISTNAD